MVVFRQLAKIVSDNISGAFNEFNARYVYHSALLFCWVLGFYLFVGGKSLGGVFLLFYVGLPVVFLFKKVFGYNVFTQAIFAYIWIIIIGYVFLLYPMLSAVVERDISVQYNLFFSIVCFVLLVPFRLVGPLFFLSVFLTYFLTKFYLGGHFYDSPFQENLMLVLGGMFIPLIYTSYLLQRKKDQEEEKISLAQGIAGVVAHEMKTPLMSFFYNAVGLKKIVDKDSFSSSKKAKALLKQTLGLMEKEAKQTLFILNIFIENIKHFSGGKLIDSNYEKKTLSLNSCVSKVIKDLSFLNPENLIKVDIPKDIKIKVIEPLFRHVISNLLKNSLEAIRKKWGLKACGKILIRAKTENRFLLIEIIDGGCGMSDTSLQRAFDPFFSKNKGMGLGLYYCFQCIKSLDGKIKIESKQDFYTIVKIKISLK